MFLLAVLVIGGFAVYVMKPDERVKLLQRGVAAAREAADLAVQYHRERDAFREALHTRTPWPIVLPVLVAVNAGVFIGMIFGAGAIADPETLVAWGASVGPRTTNGEWWRLVTALFVHTGFWHLVINMAGLVAVGLTAGAPRRPLHVRGAVFRGRRVRQSRQPDRLPAGRDRPAHPGPSSAFTAC